MAKYPKASQAYRYDSIHRSGGYTGGPAKGVLHTTEGGSLPSYDGGSKAPHFTALPDRATRTVRVYQHYDTARPSRALANAAGGVQTNNDGVIQIELVGTCDARTAAAHPSWIYWAQAPYWALDPVRDLMAWVEDEHGIPAVSTPRPWLPGGQGYGAKTPARMTQTEWDRFSGWAGHMHVPENLHSDPGAIDIRYLLDREETDMPLSEADLARVRDAVWGHAIDWGNAPGFTGSPQRADAVLRHSAAHATFAALDAARAANRAPSEVDVPALAAALVKTLTATMPAAVATAVLDAAAARLRG